MNNEHYYFIDRLKVFLVCIVIFHQSLVAFGGAGQWYYTSNHHFTGTALIAVNTIETINLTFIIPMFFLLGAILAHYSYKRHGFKEYVKRRFIRLGIPALIYGLIVHPTILYFVAIAQDVDAKWLEFVFQKNFQNFSFGPMWFVAALLVIEIIYAVIKHLKISADRIVADIWHQTPSLRATVFILIIGALLFITRLTVPAFASSSNQLGFYPLYLGMFVSGLIDARYNWTERIKPYYAYPWLTFSLLCLPLLLLSINYIKDWTPFAGGFSSQSLFLSFWEAMTCIGVCIFLTAFFLQHFNNPSPYTADLANLAFAAFILHPIAIIPLTFLFESIQITLFSKWLITGIMSCTICFGAAYLLRKIPDFKNLF